MQNGGYYKLYSSAELERLALLIQCYKQHFKGLFAAHELNWTRKRRCERPHRGLRQQSSILRRFQARCCTRRCSVVRPLSEAGARVRGGRDPTGQRRVDRATGENRRGVVRRRRREIRGRSLPDSEALRRLARDVWVLVEGKNRVGHCSLAEEAAG